MKRVAIIGAGCSGLTAIKCCLDENIEPVCFEREDSLGGLWNYSDTPKVGKGSVYKSCVINTSKEMMSFSDFPPPEDFPMFMPHRYVLNYFQLYAKHFGLLDHIKFNTPVLNIVQSQTYEATGSWMVTYQPLGSSPVTEEFEGVLICTGHHTVPYMPTFKGLNSFKGTTMHSHSYRTNQEFAGKKVLVVGIGNSAVDIAVDLSHVASQVYLSTRKGAWVISRMGFWGLPADAMANNRFLFSLPLSWLEWGVEKMANFRFDHEHYGLQPQHRALQAHPTINDELPYRIMTGSLRVKPNIHSFYEDRVQFSDGTCEDIDAVIFATGFEYKIGIVNESVTKIERNETRLYKYMFPPHLQHPSLAVIGMVQAIGAVMPISEMQCRWFTRILKGLHTLPSKEDMIEDIDHKRQIIDDSYVRCQRHTIQCFWIEYMDELATQIGVKPDLYKLFHQDPGLAVRCLFGPCLPAQYRLMGPGKWDGADAVIRTSMDRCLKPMKTRILPKNFCAKQCAKNLVITLPGYLKSYFVLVFIVFALFCMCVL